MAPTLPSAFFGSKASTKEDGIYGITVKDIDGRDLSLSKFKGKVLLISNSASACGFTPQQSGLAALAKQYKGKLEVLVQPCNQFGGQDPKENLDIKKFAAGNGLGVGGAGTMLAKADVNGNGATPLFDYLKSKKGGLLTSDIKWNFTKFLVSPTGEGKRGWSADGRKESRCDADQPALPINLISLLFPLPPQSSAATRPPRRPRR